MLVGIIADLHANLEATRRVFRELDEIKPDLIVCLGDIVGYNANPNEVLDMVRSRKIPCVMGNHDAVICGQEDPCYFSSKATAALEWQGERIRPDNRRWLTKAKKRLGFEEQFLAVHGSPGHRDAYILDWMDAMRQFQLLDGTGIKITFFGHSHQAGIFGEHRQVETEVKDNKVHLSPDNRYLINPGSVGQPRDKDPRAAFGTMDTEKLVFEFHRVEYDIDAAARKIIQAGLPEKLASRLYKGK